MINKSVIFVFAHQDDEILIAGKILDEISKGTSVHLAWLNDGSGGTGLYKSRDDMMKDYSPHFKPGESLDSLSQDRIKEILCIVRENEARAAMLSLGVPDENMSFFKHPAEWMKTPGNFPQMVAELKDLFSRIKPDEVYCDAWEGAHISHDIAHFTAVQAARTLPVPQPPVFEFPEYPFLKSYKSSILKHFKKSKTTSAIIHLLHYGIGQFADAQGKHFTLKLSDEQIKIKSDLMRFYTSQSKLTGDFDGIIKARAAIATFLPHLRHQPDVEMWRAVPASRDYRIPPCKGHRYSEYNQGISDEDYVKMFSGAINALK